MFTNIIDIIAPTAAPLDTPINPGSTRKFLNKPCKIAPEVPSPIPTSKARNILGNRILKITVSCIWLYIIDESLKLNTNLFKRMWKICLRLIETGPITNDNNIKKININIDEIKNAFLIFNLFSIKI